MPYFYVSSTEYSCFLGQWTRHTSTQLLTSLAANSQLSQVINNMELFSSLSKKVFDKSSSSSITHYVLGRALSIDSYSQYVCQPQIWRRCQIGLKAYLLLKLMFHVQSIEQLFLFFHFLFKSLICSFSIWIPVKQLFTVPWQDSDFVGEHPDAFSKLGSTIIIIGGSEIHNGTKIHNLLWKMLKSAHYAVNVIKV